ncbi:MAG: hypothetical protein ACR2L3_00375 [Actinomycetota bacterium]
MTKIKILAPLMLIVLVAATFAAPASLAAKKKKAPTGPVEIGTDPAGDWGCNVDCGLNPIGTDTGQDLTSASLEMADKDNVNFVIGLEGLPPTGGIPELVRYTWNFSVGKQAFQMSGGFTEYVRGICNPNTPNTCPPPRDPGSAPFFLRQGSCNVGEECTEVALVHATFSAADGTITIPVPLEVLKAKPGSKVVPGATALGGTIYAVNGLFVTSSTLPLDTLTATGTYTIPKIK